MTTKSDLSEFASRQALAALYDATNGPGWENNTNWKSKRPLSEWYGVTTDDHGQAVELQLSDNKLRGSLSGVPFSNLLDLEVLDLSHNGLTGTMPPRLGNMIRLRRLDLSHNTPRGPEHGGRAGPQDWRRAKGTLPTGLTGSIPPELGNASSLEEVFLNANRLTGDIPNLGSLKQLRVLALEVNDLSGSIPHWIGNLAKLEKLNLSWNQLSGRIPPELGQLSGLSELALGNNTDLSGELPTEIGGLSKLRALWLRNTGLAGPLPDSLAGLKNLQRFYYRDTGLYVPSDAGLREWLQGTPDHAGRGEREILAAFFQSTGGTRCWRNSQNWESDLPVGEWYGVETDNSGQVVKLQLDRNGLTGPIPHDLGGLVGLRNLHLEFNDLNGGIPADLGSLDLLESLNLSWNNLTGAVPAVLGALSELSILALGHNDLSGEIDAPPGSFPKLRELWLRNSGLVDPPSSSPLSRVRRS